MSYVQAAGDARGKVFWLSCLFRSRLSRFLQSGFTLFLSLRRILHVLCRMCFLKALIKKGKGLVDTMIRLPTSLLHTNELVA